jgi:hypothetical protein
MIWLRGSAAVSDQPTLRARVWPGVLLCVVLLALLSGCTRYEETVTLSLHRRSTAGWEFEWRALARRGINLVDSSGNVGGASASFPCHPHASRPDVWLLDGPVTDWKEKGAAVGKLGPKPAGQWRGEVRMEADGTGKVMVVELHDAKGRPFVGNARYQNAQGNGETWVALRK